MKDKHVFVDTNILIYAHDIEAGSKHDRAANVLENLWNKSYPPAISIQVMQEFYVNIIKRGVDQKTAWDTVRHYLHWEVVDNTSILFKEAVRIQQRYKISFWDSSIVAAAKQARAAELWSEDLSTGQKYEDILVVNPLSNESTPFTGQ